MEPIYVVLKQHKHLFSKIVKRSFSNLILFSIQLYTVKEQRPRTVKEQRPRALWRANNPFSVNQIFSLISFPIIFWMRPETTDLSKSSEAVISQLQPPHSHPSPATLASPAPHKHGDAHGKWEVIGLVKGHYKITWGNVRYRCPQKCNRAAEKETGGGRVLIRKFTEGLNSSSFQSFTVHWSFNLITAYSFLLPNK